MKTTTRTFLAVALAFLVPAAAASAGRAVSRGGARTSVNRTTNVNRNTNVNVNRNVNVHRDVDVHGGYYGGGCCYHPIATAAAVTATVAITAAVVGSIVHTIPPSCTSVIVNGFGYQQCGSTWYQPQFVGGATTYVVIAPPG